MGTGILHNDRRMINGVAGSIGSSLPMAGGARVVEPGAPIFAVLGDGTFGFHMSESKRPCGSNCHTLRSSARMPLERRV